MKNEWKKGRGAQINTPNRFHRYSLDEEALEGIDDYEHLEEKTVYIRQQSKSILNRVTSPDVPMLFSLNPYQGCEHGCIYCYARNSHEFWGYSAGTEFEQKIVIKENAVALLKKEFDKRSWKGEPISLSGNTDCYQPVERRTQLTRKLLELCLQYRNPVGIITKNALILRDLDILQALAQNDLVSVYTSVTSTDEKLRAILEPRTTTYKSRLQIVETLAKHDIHCGIMNAPIIPAINDHHTAQVLQAAADAGAKEAGYTIVRLNGAVADVFRDWLFRTWPDRAEKVWHYIEDAHGGQVQDSRFKTRMKGEGKFALLFSSQFKLLCRKFGLNQSSFHLSSDHFRRPDRPEQLTLF